MKFDGFNWDAGNANKCPEHGLTQVVIEYFFQQGTLYVAPDIKHSICEERFLAIGKGLKKKMIIVAFTFRNQSGKKLLRPISARFMNKKEVQKYEKEFKKNQNK